MSDFYVSVTPVQADKIISDYIVGGSITGVLLDSYKMSSGAGEEIIVSVYEKHYYRAGNRLTLTVTIDNLSGKTQVHTVGGGGGEGLFRWDWGASEAFQNSAYTALRNYIID